MPASAWRCRERAPRGHRRRARREWQDDAGPPPRRRAPAGLHRHRPLLPGRHGGRGRRRARRRRPRAHRGGHAADSHRDQHRAGRHELGAPRRRRGPRRERPGIRATPSCSAPSARFPRCGGICWRCSALRPVRERSPSDAIAGRSSPRRPGEALPAGQRDSARGAPCRRTGATPAALPWTTAHRVRDRRARPHRRTVNISAAGAILIDTASGGIDEIVEIALRHCAAAGVVGRAAADVAKAQWSARAARRPRRRTSPTHRSPSGSCPSPPCGGTHAPGLPRDPRRAPQRRGRGERAASGRTAGGEQSRRHHRSALDRRLPATSRRLLHGQERVLPASGGEAVHRQGPCLPRGAGHGGSHRAAPRAEAAHRGARRPLPGGPSQSGREAPARPAGGRVPGSHRRRPRPARRVMGDLARPPGSAPGGRAEPPCICASASSRPHPHPGHPWPACSPASRSPTCSCAGSPPSSPAPGAGSSPTATRAEAPPPVATQDMSRDLVAFDLETTGLSPKSDRIIEIGAVHFSLDGGEGRDLQMLVDPAMPVPRRPAPHGHQRRDPGGPAVAGGGGRPARRLL